MKLLLLDCYMDPAGGAENFLRRLGGFEVSVTRPTREDPPTLEGFDGVLINGSAASIADGVPWIERVYGVVRAAVRDQVPMLGVCFGHQAIAGALGGGGAVRKAALPEVGWRRIDVQDRADPVMGALPGSFHTFLSHEDEVAPGVPGLSVIASSEACPVQAIKVDGAPVWGVQFHTEMGRAEADGLIAWRAEKHPQLRLNVEAEQAKASLGMDVAPVLFGAFLRQVG